MGGLDPLKSRDHHMMDVGTFAGQTFPCRGLILLGKGSNGWVESVEFRDHHMIDFQTFASQTLFCREFILLCKKKLRQFA